MVLASPSMSQTCGLTSDFKAWLSESVLGPLLFNIYLNDLFFTLKNIADDTTPYICDNGIEKVLNLLERNSELALCWVENNYETD